LNHVSNLERWRSFVPRSWSASTHFPAHPWKVVGCLYSVENKAVRGTGGYCPVLLGVVLGLTGICQTVVGLFHDINRNDTDVIVDNSIKINNNNYNNNKILIITIIVIIISYDNNNNNNSSSSSNNSNNNNYTFPVRRPGARLVP
jgi:hypothetical protein